MLKSPPITVAAQDPASDTASSPELVALADAEWGSDAGRPRRRRDGGGDEMNVKDVRPTRLREADAVMRSVRGHRERRLKRHSL